MGATSLAAPYMSRARSTVGFYLLVSLATWSFVVAAVHFAFAPTHFGEAVAFGSFFLVIGWLQLIWAPLVVWRPHRWVLASGALLNAGIIAVWAVSRTTGLPFGPEPGEAEAIGVPDVLCTVLEAAIVIGAVALLVRPALADRPLRTHWVGPAFTAVFGVAALVLASFSVTPAWAGEHEHDHGAAGHSHSHTDPTAWATGTSPCERSGPPASPEQVANLTSGHNHRGSQPQVDIDESARVQLRAEQTQAASVASQFPTAADAQKAGYRLSVVYVPCIGEHYTNIAYTGKIDPAHPSELLYDGSTPQSKIIGLSYLLYHPGGAPAGFIGPNDHWHQHSFNGGLCMSNSGVVIGPESMTAAKCQAAGGHKNALKDIWMLHDWVVPGWSCSWGVFAPECPELGGRAGGNVYEQPTEASKQLSKSIGE
jgi:hypothetical protein